MAGPQCCENPPILDPNSGSGSLIELAGLKTYAVGPCDSKLAVLLAGDAFGCDAPKLRKLADKVAAAGFYVVVPDFFHGQPYDPNNPDMPLPLWLKIYNTDRGVEEAKPIIAALRSRGVTAIGGAGFCWGAKVVVDLAKSDCIQAAVLVHPALITLDDIKEVKAPTCVLGAEIDKSCPVELAKQFDEVLSARPEVDGFVKIFPGTVHGWAVRYKDEDVEVVKKAEEAHQDLLNWFIQYVK